MCNWLKKKEKISIPDSIPNMTADEVIAELEYDILIHENWAVYVVQYPSYAASMGDYDWHMRWIAVYEAAIYYLKGQQGV